MDPAARAVLLTRGLIAGPSRNAYPPAACQSFHWVVKPEGGVIPSSCTCYVDGSMLDGPCIDFGRVGFGLHAIDGEGKCVASAYGNPPPWIRTVHGVEVWAFYAAASRALPGVAFRSDCLEVVRAFQCGVQWATAAGRPLARAWRL
eukprot:4328112-Karenia_brevis.AAC.1